MKNKLRIFGISPSSLIILFILASIISTEFANPQEINSNKIISDETTISDKSFSPVPTEITTKTQSGIDFSSYAPVYLEGRTGIISLNSILKDKSPYSWDQIENGDVIGDEWQATVLENENQIGKTVILEKNVTLNSTANVYVRVWINLGTTFSTDYSIFGMKP